MAVAYGVAGMVNAGVRGSLQQQQQLSGIHIQFSFFALSLSFFLMMFFVFCFGGCYFL